MMVRLPEDLRDRIKDAAEANSVSINSEIVELLERSYPALPLFLRSMVTKMHNLSFTLKKAKSVSELSAALDEMERLQSYFKEMLENQDQYEKLSGVDLTVLFNRRMGPSKDDPKDPSE
ncbi:hypothetical protein Z950_1724 [Sulfitobacter mediterraneus KCTC 32188]|nr:hypothetical protein Z950_1724 [Sulfitobacter mediterraneus KCTC 32188]